MKIQEGASLKEYNTFGIEAHCKGLIPIYSEQDIYECLVKGLSPLRILGGGSNVLLKSDLEDFVLLNAIKGIEIVDEDAETVLVSVGSGEKWHNFVLWTISHNLGGLENLSLIPGCVGAAPMQNIGAYGVEQSDCFHSLKGIDLERGISRTFFPDDCQFGYRDSTFKHAYKDKFVITQVNYLLHKNHKLNTSYGAIQKMLGKRGIKEPSIKDVSDVVIAIRQSKLPDPQKIGNAGSFFKNPIVPKSVLDAMHSHYEQIPHYPQEDGRVKIPAGWLIEQAGFKGKRIGNTGSYENQALVILNYGGASGNEIWKHAKNVQQTVKDQFDIDLEMEVNIWE